MAHVDAPPEGGKFRAVAAAGLDGTAGAWGDGDLLCVQVDANGELALGSATVCDGVILTSEGRSVQAADATAHKDVVGGRKYTVFRIATIVEAEVGSSPALSAGDKVWAQASGDASVSATPGVGAIFLGFVMADVEGGGSRLELVVNGREPSAA